MEFNGTFSALNACCTNINSEFQQTWTILATGFNGTFSTLSNLTTTVTNHFAATWTILAAGFNGTFSTIANINEANATFTALADLTTTITNDFAATWTILATGFNGTFSALNACCTNINSEFQQTWTILAAGFNGTFSTLPNLTADFAATWTILAAGFNGTFSALNACCTNITSEFQQTWTILAAGFNGTFSTLAAILGDFNATWTILAAGFNGTFSALNTCCTNITSEFQQTWTILNVLTENLSNPVMITQANFGATGGTTYTISTSGVYRLGSNIVFTPATAIPAILITTTDVVLDLQLFNLTQGNATTGVNAIQVSSGMADVYIKNGLIENFTRAAISFQGSNQRVGIDTTTTISCAVTGIEFVSTGTPSQNITIQHCNIYNCSTASGATFPLNLQLCKEGKIKNCNFNSNGTSSNNINVLNFSGCVEFIVKDISVKENLGSFLNCVSLDSTSSLNYFNNCSILNNQSNGNTLDGFVMNGSNSNIFNNCIVNGNQGTSNGSFNGFIMQSGAYNNTFNSCTASYNTTSGSTATIVAFNLGGPYNFAFNCVAESNICGGNQCYGCLVSTSTNIIDNFVAANNMSGGTSDCYGININQAAAYNNVISNCLCSNNNSATNGDTVGISNSSLQYLFYRNVSYSNNGTQISGIASPGSLTTPTAPASQNLGTVTGAWTNLALAS